MTDVDVSIVVCTYNRAELLRDALENLAALRTDGRYRWEVVAVDNASTDGTGRVIEDAARRSPVPMRGVCETRKGVASARNCGIRAARGEWIAFFDDDQAAAPDWLLRLLHAAERHAARCVGGAVRLLLPEEVIEELPPVCRRLLGESAAPAAACRFSRKVAAGTGNLLVHRTVFDEIGPFDESLREAGEDTDLNRRLLAAGIEAWFEPAAVVYHAVPPYRLEENYFRWVSLRNGMHVARREREAWPRAAFPLILAARLGQAAVRCVSGSLHGALTGAQRRRLAARCHWWRAQGYARFALSRLAPRWFGREDSATRLDFRDEREMFARG